MPRGVARPRHLRALRSLRQRWADSPTDSLSPMSSRMHLQGSRSPSFGATRKKRPAVPGSAGWRALRPRLYPCTHSLTQESREQSLTAARSRSRAIACMRTVPSKARRRREMRRTKHEGIARSSRHCPEGSRRKMALDWRACSPLPTAGSPAWLHPREENRRSLRERLAGSRQSSSAQASRRKASPQHRVAQYRRPACRQEARPPNLLPVHVPRQLPRECAQ